MQDFTIFTSMSLNYGFQHYPYTTIYILVSWMVGWMETLVVDMPGCGSDDYDDGGGCCWLIVVVMILMFPAQDYH